MFIPGTSALTNGIEEWEVSLNKARFSDEEKHEKAQGQRYKRKRPVNSSEEDDEPSTRRKPQMRLFNNNESVLVNSFTSSSPEGNNVHNKIFNFI